MDALPSLREFSRQAVGAALEKQADLPDLLVVDGTAGNGHDALFLARTLARLSPSFRLLAFDLQEAALAATRSRLAAAGLDGYLQCLAHGHETLARHLGAERIAAAMFNLGFLPRSDRALVTKAATTLAALEAALSALRPRGILSVHAYGGHPGGREELAAVEDWFSALPASRATAARYALCNKPRNPEVLFLAQPAEGPS
ncbi:MAG: class I SAM-dependent methyltransferase [Desulfovibrio sp.]|jgi:hypothetical protein|nr:class I SAM-dependent methyltransferase [Desulfovibrio sp.]